MTEQPGIDIINLPPASRIALATRVRELRKTLNKLEGSLQVDQKGIGLYEFSCVQALMQSACAEWQAVCTLAEGGEVAGGLFDQEDEE